MEFRPRQGLIVLADSKVEFVVVGGVAAAMLGSLRETTDVDILVRRSSDNLARLARGLTEVGARVRGSARPAMPISPALLEGVEVMTFDTEVGEVDVLLVGRGGWTYERVIGGAERVDVAGREVSLISMDDLIAMKRAAGRPKDLETVEELEALRRLAAVAETGGDTPASASDPDTGPGD
jgi:hypothetical protein